MFVEYTTLQDKSGSMKADAIEGVEQGPGPIVVLYLKGGAVLEVRGDYDEISRSWRSGIVSLSMKISSRD